MTVSTSAPDGVELLRNWLLPFDSIPTGEKKPVGTVPYRMITTLPGKDDKVTEFGFFRVHHFNADFTACKTAAYATHDRIMELGPPFYPQQRVTISGGKVVFIDCVRTDETPHWEYYSDTMERFVAEYYIDLRRVAV